MKTKYVVVTSQECMPASCWGKYGRVAVMEMEETAPFPKMISPRARGCVRVVSTWNKRFWGASNRCALCRAQAEARRLAAELNRAKCTGDAK